MTLLMEAMFTPIFVGGIEPAANFTALMGLTVMKIIIVNNHSLLYKQCLLCSRHYAGNLIQSMSSSQHSTIITRTAPNIWETWGKSINRAPFHHSMDYAPLSSLPHMSKLHPYVPLAFTSHKQLPFDYQYPQVDRPGKDSLLGLGIKDLNGENSELQV